MSRLCVEAAPFSMPWGKTGRSAKGQPRKSTCNPDPPMAIIVDDHASSAFMLAEMVRKIGWRAKEAFSAEDLFKQKRLLKRVDCILLDLHMPGGMSGFDAASKIIGRDRKNAFDLSCIAVTGDSRFFDSETVCPFGFLDVIPKPLNCYLVERIMRSHFQF